MWKIKAMIYANCEYRQTNLMNSLPVHSALVSATSKCRVHLRAGVGTFKYHEGAVSVLNVGMGG